MQTGAGWYGQDQRVLSPIPIWCMFLGINSWAKKKTNSDTGHLPLTFCCMLSLQLPVWTLVDVSPLTPSWSILAHQPYNTQVLLWPQVQRLRRSACGNYSLPHYSHSLLNDYRCVFFWVKTLSPLSHGSHGEVFDEDWHLSRWANFSWHLFSVPFHDSCFLTLDSVLCQNNSKEKEYSLTSSLQKESKAILNALGSRKYMCLFVFALVLLAKRLNPGSRGWWLKETKVLPPGLGWVESGWEMGGR